MADKDFESWDEDLESWDPIRIEEMQINNKKENYGKKDRASEPN